MNRTNAPRDLLLAMGLLLLLVLATLVTACSSAPQATPTPTRTPRPAQTVALPPPTASPQPTARPTDTPAPTQTPAATPTANSSASPGAPAPSATATNSPQGTPAATSAPSAPPPAAPGPLAPAPTRDPGVSPFTGLKPADPSVLARRPLAIKVTNDADAQAKQAGLNRADVVVESRVEYSETRLTAIYHSQDAPRVGPIRSARLIDVELPVIFDAILAFSGGVEPVRQLLYHSDLGDHILEQALNGSAFYRDPSVGGLSWNTLFANTATLWDTATRRGWNVAPKPSGAWAFSADAPAGAGANKIELAYPLYRVVWTYEANTGRWLRSVAGKPNIDRADGQQVSAANVVVLGANHVVTLIIEDGDERRIVNGVCINCSIEIQLWGEGPAKVLRDGRVYEGRWVRPERHAPFRIVDAAGRDIPLKPGNSWWQVAPLDLKVTITP